jgi:Flp pilus assembly protein TadG
VHGAVVFLLAFVIFLIGYFAGKEIWWVINSSQVIWRWLLAGRTLGYA